MVHDISLSSYLLLGHRPAHLGFRILDGIAQEITITAWLGHDGILTPPVRGG
jgi:hypothetical protein